jgi:hypothetical protein
LSQDDGFVVYSLEEYPKYFLKVPEIAVPLQRQKAIRPDGKAGKDNKNK